MHKGRVRLFDEISIGVDLGTRYAQVAVDIPGRGVRIIPNRWGTKRTPSMVAFTPDGLIAGEDASRVMLTKPDTVWWDMKRHLGSDWVARVGYRSYTPEELLLPLLSLLREDAEANLGKFVSSCVLAVPAHFSFPERGALARAARTAGFERVRIVNEPTAAALSTGINGRFLIIDFGAGTLDMSLVEGDAGVFQVVESQGRRDIGGLDIDRLLAEWLCKNTGIPLSRPGDPRAALMLKEAEDVKIELSGANRVVWRVPSGLSEGERSIEITRHEFESLIYPLMEDILKMVEKMWKKYSPQRLLMVGGSSRIPLLGRLMASRVREPDRVSASPEDAVVTGSAMYTHQGKERLLIDVLSKSLGIMNADGKVVPILRKGSPLPAESRQTFTACGNGSIEVTIVQGERKVKSIARVLQTLTVDGVSNGETVEVFFRVDGGGLLHVEVKRKKKVSRKTISLENDEIGEAQCDLTSEMRVREERLARLSLAYPDNFQSRLSDITKDVRSLRNEDSSLQWEALEVVDRMIAELERVTS
ncbi:MAG: Hsp70 family protein [Synergistaceae bacterium]|jgi:molecular chaperone DnaK (HSP70)|nr:Hsp70 family protein [Synergistaceae bacterium]